MCWRTLNTGPPGKQRPQRWSLPMSVVSAFPPQPRSSCERGGTQHGVGEIRAESALTHLGKWAQHTTRGGGVSGPETLPPRSPRLLQPPTHPHRAQGAFVPPPRAFEGKQRRLRQSGRPGQGEPRMGTEPVRQGPSRGTHSPTHCMPVRRTGKIPRRVPKIQGGLGSVLPEDQQRPNEKVGFHAGEDSGLILAQQLARKPLLGEI